MHCHVLSTVVYRGVDEFVRVGGGYVVVKYIYASILIFSHAQQYY